MKKRIRKFLAFGGLILALAAVPALGMLLYGTTL